MKEGMIDSSQKMTRSFNWLNAAQFGGALNDNVFRLLVVFFLIGMKGEGAASLVTSVVGAIFVLPFLLFTPAAGILADRYSKRNITVVVKSIEILSMMIALVAFHVRNEWLAYGVVFLMSTQSALFGPSKYGILKELVGKQRLSRANSLLVLFTYLAIILGTGLAPSVDHLTNGNYVAAAGVCLLIAVAGLFAIWRVEVTPGQGGERRISPNVIGTIWKTLVSIRHDGFLMLAVMAAAYFLLIAGFVQINLIPYGIEMLGISEQNSAYLFLLAALGIGLGAWVVGRLSGRNIELGLVPIGVAGVVIGAMGLYLFSHSLVATCVMVFVLGVSAGFYIVPLEAFVQYRSPDKRRGEILAAKGFLAWIGVLFSAILLYVFAEVLKLTPAQGFLVVGVATTAMLFVAFYVLPDFFVRFVVTLITKLVYRIRVIGQEHVPTEEPALLVANHVSWVDALLLTATQPRRIRFMIHRQIYERRLLRPFFRLMGVIPISYQDPARKIADSLDAARASLDDGYLVCLFAEGAVTRSGMLETFRGGFERIVRDGNVPVVPVYIGGQWGSVFSYFYGKPLTRWPGMIPYPASVLFGNPLTADTPAALVRRNIMELSVEYFHDLKPRRRSLGEEFVIMARHHWRQPAINDTTGKSLSFGRTLTAAVALADILKRDTAKQSHIGILLPSSVGGVLANVAVTLSGKVPVNLNYIASADFRGHCIKECGVRTVLTSKKFIEKLETLDAPEGAVYLEDLLPRITAGKKIKALLKSRFMPRRRLARTAGFHADDLATVMFSSGSTGTPKGVMLSHHNILSNVEAFRMVYRPTREDNICAALPFFHSFGYTATMWFPLLSGFAASYHTNPLDGEQIANVVREHRCSLLLATPTFLLGYIRKATEEDFKSLRYVVVGAEKLKKGVSDAFEKKFGLKPLEGYGTTECSPVVAVNLPPVEIDGVHLSGTKEGSVGQPLPGVAVKVVEPDTFEPVPLDGEGLLLVRGPNVMLGYLNMPDKTKEVIKDGWYVTGDIVRLDSEGFITITDRLSRFSKIGGEMVPHIAVEEAYYKGLGTMEQVLTVTSAPHPRKGEQLVVLHTAAGDPASLHEIIKKSDLPNLWKPDRKAYHKVDTIPVLGSGKLDFKAVREMAAEFPEE